MCVRQTECVYVCVRETERDRERKRDSEIEGDKDKCISPADFQTSKYVIHKFKIYYQKFCKKNTTPNQKR